MTPDARPPLALDRVVVGFDASPPSIRAARLAVALGHRGRTQLWLVYGYRPDARLAEPLTDEEVRSPVRAVERAMEAVVREAADVGLVAHARTVEGDPAAVLLRCADEVGAGLIVVGTRGLGGAAKVLLGSVSTKVLTGAAVPVTVVP